MIQQLLSILPQQIHPIALIIAVSGAVLGGILWLGGSRFSRTVVTLLCVSTGPWSACRCPSGSAGRSKAGRPPSWGP